MLGEVGNNSSWSFYRVQRLSRYKEQSDFSYIPSDKGERPDSENISQEKRAKLDLSKSLPSKDSKESSPFKKELSLRDKLALEKLKRRDREVRNHEMAHVLAGGPYVLGGPHYIFVVGPDGKLYAVGGEVKIDLSPVPNDPDATIRKAETIKRAALAPANPSAQDRAVAAKAEQMAMKARMEKLKKQLEELQQKQERDFKNTQEISFQNNISSNFISYIEQFNKKMSLLLANKSYLNISHETTSSFEQIV